MAQEISCEKMLNMMQSEMESDPDHVVERGESAKVIWCIDSKYRICQYSIVRFEESKMTHYAFTQSRKG